MEKPGDTIKVVTEDKEFEGILMPQEKDFLVIKLKNGYNIGIARHKIRDIQLIVKHENKITKQKSEEQDPSLPMVSILHTGGTIASKVDYSTGAVVAKYTPTELLEKFPELTKIARIKSRLVANMMSENIRFAHYNIMAKEIEKEVKDGAKGVIITHGTDTLHYTSAALSFMLENLQIPVLLVGAQRSSDRGSSDAAYNLIAATTFIANTDFTGVAVCMHEGTDDNKCIIIPGTNARKMHASRRDAFKAINSKPIATVDNETKKIEFLNNNNNNKAKSILQPEKKLILKLFRESIKVGLIKSHPNMYASEFLHYLGYDGVVLEGTGLGHAPINATDEFTSENQRIRESIKQLSSSGSLVIMALQTIYGRVNMDVYSAGRQLQEIGVKGNMSDMTPETTYIKLAWLLSNYPKEEAAKLIEKNLRGEISDRSEE